mgnify:CR=1 FL=1
MFTGISWEAEMVKNLLENEGIQVFLINEHIGTLAPFYSTPGPGSVQLVVSSLDAPKARDIVDEFEKDRYNKNG